MSSSRHSAFTGSSGACAAVTTPCSGRSAGRWRTSWAISTSFTASTWRRCIRRWLCRPSAWKNSTMMSWYSHYYSNRRGLGSIVYGRPWNENEIYLAHIIPGVPEKASRFDFIRQNIVFWKEWYQDHWNWVRSFDSMVISQNIATVNFLFILVTFQSRIMAFLTSIHCCPEAHLFVQTGKHRENLWTAIPAVNSSRKFKNICKWPCFKKWL